MVSSSHLFPKIKLVGIQAIYSLGKQRLLPGKDADHQETVGIGGGVEEARASL